MSSGLVLNTNINSLVAQNALSSSGTQLASALEQLSTGLRINTAADDAAGYAIVNGMTSQINGLNQAAQNANDGVSLAQTGSGALSEIVNDLQSMRDLAVESLNATNSSSDRADLDAQFQQLKADINSVASTTQFNGVNLLDGTFQGATFQIGANAGQTITVSSVASASASNLGQLYTAGATDPAAYTSDGTATGAAVASGDSGTVTLTIGGKAYTTSAISLTGTQSTDLASVAAAINQATGSAGVIATVDSTGKGINLSSTTQQTVAASYSATTGTETLATFGLKASSSLTPQTTYAATGTAVSGDTLSAGTTTYAVTGGTVSDNLAGATTYTMTGGTPTTDTNGDNGTFSVIFGGNTYTTASVPLTGNMTNDLTTIAGDLNSATDTGGASLSSAGVTVSVVGGKLQFSSASSLTGLSASYTAGTGSETSTNFGLNSLTAGSSTGTPAGTASVVIGGNTYTTSAISGLTGTASNDIGQVASALNAVTSFSTAGYVASVNASNELVITGGSTAFTVTSASFTGSGGTTGSLSLGIAGNTAATGTTSGASSGTVSVVIGGSTYTTGTLSGFNGTVANDAGKIAAGLNAVASFSSAGYVASVNASNQLVITGGTSAFTVTSAAYTGTGAISLGMSNTAATGSSTGASTSTLENANVKTVDGSNQVLIQIDAALQQLATTGADLGAYQNRFQAAVSGLQADSTNLSSARSQIRDTNYALTTSNLTQAQILQQAGTAMVAQANMVPQNVLSLLQKLP